MTPVRYKHSTDKELIEILEVFVKKTQMKSDNLVAFFGTSLSSLKRWKIVGEKGIRVPNITINLIEFHSALTQQREDFNIEINDLKQQNKELKDFRNNFRDLVNSAIGKVF